MKKAEGASRGRKERTGAVPKVDQETSGQRRGKRELAVAIRWRVEMNDMCFVRIEVAASATTRPSLPARVSTSLVPASMLPNSCCGSTTGVGDGDGANGRSGSSMSSIGDDGDGVGSDT